MFGIISFQKSFQKIFSVKNKVCVCKKQEKRDTERDGECRVEKY